MKKTLFNSSSTIPWFLGVFWLFASEVLPGKGLLNDAQHPTKKLLEFQKERNVTHSTFFKKQSFKAGSEITEMIELAEELLKPLISICLMKHKNKQGEKLGKINKWDFWNWKIYYWNEHLD